MTATLQSNVKPPKRRGRLPENVRRAAQEYKEAYIAVYGLRPSVSYAPSTKWFTLLGVTQRVNLKRLKELTAQLRRRMG